MILVRQELETKLKAFAEAQVPPILIAYEDKSFEKPVDNSGKYLPFLECVIVPAATINVTVDGNRIRELGVMQVNVWYPSGKGAGFGEALANKVIAHFPVVPISGTVVITQTPFKSRAIKDESGWRIVPVTINYRQEGEVIAT